MEQGRTDRPTDRQTDRQTDRRIDRQAGRQTDGRTDGRTDRERGRRQRVAEADKDRVEKMGSSIKLAKKASMFGRMFRVPSLHVPVVNTA